MEITWNDKQFWLYVYTRESTTDYWQFELELFGAVKHEIQM